MESYVDVLIERAEMARNWKKYVSSIARAVRSILADSKIYVFGSAIKGELTGGSDVDILVVSERVPRSNLERAELKVKIEELSNLPPYHPFELHLVDREEGGWYLKRIKDILEYESA